MKIKLVDASYGSYAVETVGPNTQSLLIQTDYDLPSLAIIFGWTLPPRRIATGSATRDYCRHPGTDGTATCPRCGMTSTRFISRARRWLNRNIGTMVEDPGYFTEETT